MTKENSTEIVFVVDRSGSMSSIAADMRGGFDAFLAEQKKVPGECRVSLTRFDDQYEVVYEGRSLAEVPPLDLQPRGSTALLDAVGRTIDAVGARLAAMPEHERPSKVLFVIITDGAENASREYNRRRVFEMITTQRTKFSWDFVFLGANQDAFAVAEGLGIDRGMAMNYAASGVGANSAMKGFSARAAVYRSAKGSAALDNLQASYDQQIAGSGVTAQPHPWPAGSIEVKPGMSGVSGSAPAKPSDSESTSQKGSP